MCFSQVKRIPQLVSDSYFNNPWVFIGRVLMAGVIVSMTRAFALTNLFEILLLVIFVSVSDLRHRFCEVLKDPKVLVIFVFWGWIACATFWGVAPLEDRLNEVLSWRKLLLVPFTVVLFDTLKSRMVLVGFFLFTCAVYMIVSWLGYVSLIEIDRAPSEVLENHSTQGILFVISGMIAIIWLSNLKRQFGLKAILVLLAMGFLLNLLMVITGRSGYVTLASVSLVVSWFLIPPKYRLVTAILVPVCLVFTLSVFEKPRTRILQAFDEIVFVDDATESSSLGIRVVMWENTVAMIANKPLLGSGSGSYSRDYDQIVAGGVGWQFAPTDNPHQQYLHIAAEQGIVGLMLFLFILVFWVSSGVKLLKSTQYLWAVGGLAILASYFMNGFANGHFSSFVEGRLFWVALVICLSPIRTALRENLSH